MPIDPADEPTRAVPRSNPRLTASQRWTAVGLAVACVLGAGVVAALMGLVTGGGTGEIAWSAVVYGGLLAAAAVVLYVDHVHALRCPRCGERFERGTRQCPACAYDVETRPRYACSERHDTYLEPGLCGCGRRLQPIPPPRGVRSQVVATVLLGVGILVFLVAVWGVLALVG